MGQIGNKITIVDRSRVHGRLIVGIRKMRKHETDM